MRKATNVSSLPSISQYFTSITRTAQEIFGGNSLCIRYLTTSKKKEKEKVDKPTLFKRQEKQKHNPAKEEKKKKEEKFPVPIHPSCNRSTHSPMGRVSTPSNELVVLKVAWHCCPMLCADGLGGWASRNVEKQRIISSYFFCRFMSKKGGNGC